MISARILERRLHRTQRVEGLEWGHRVELEFLERVHDRVIHESWESSAGQFKGESLNVYNRETNRREQTWVDITGARLVITARCNDDSVEGLMFEGENVRPGAEPQLTRMHVRPVEDGCVMQTGYTSDDDGKTWEQKYEFMYVPKGESYSPAES